MNFANVIKLYNNNNFCKCCDANQNKQLILLFSDPMSCICFHLISVIINITTTQKLWVQPWFNNNFLAFILGKWVKGESKILNLFIYRWKNQYLFAWVKLNTESVKILLSRVRRGFGPYDSRSVNLFRKTFCVLTVIYIYWNFNTIKENSILRIMWAFAVSIAYTIIFTSRILVTDYDTVSEKHGMELMKLNQRYEIEILWTRWIRNFWMKKLKT